MERDDLHEIIVGLVGGIGTDFEKIVEELKLQFTSMGYITELIHLTDLIKIGSLDKYSYIESCNKKIKVIDEMRSKKINVIAKLNKPGILSYCVINRIHNLRNNNLSNGKRKEDKNKHIVYIIYPFKHPDEYTILRHVYRRNFIFLSIYTNKNQRRRFLINKENYSFDKLGRKKNNFDKVVKDVDKIMQSDEKDKDGHRNVLDTYHKAHYFITEDNYRYDVERLINLIFSNHFVTPTKEELSMLVAYSVSLRSSDLSRQVGR